MEPLSLWEVMEGMGVLEVVCWGGVKALGVSRPEFSGIPELRARADDMLVVGKGPDAGRLWDAADAADARLSNAMAIPRAMLFVGQLLVGG